MTYQLLAGLAVALGTHNAASFVQTYLHYRMGHHRRGGRTNRYHLQYHHAIYSRTFVTDRYVKEDKDVSLYYIPVAVFIAAAAYMLLPVWLFVVHVIAMAASFAAHTYVHAQYHLRTTWLQRFAWFCRKQRLHAVHHRNPSKNFAVLGFVWDRCLGTYQAPRQEVDHAR